MYMKFQKMWKCNLDIIDLDIIDDITGQAKVGMFDFRIGDIGKQNFDVKRQQLQWISMDSVSDIC